MFYTQTFAGTVFVTNDGSILYSVHGNRWDDEIKNKTVLIREKINRGIVSGIKGTGHSSDIDGNPEDIAIGIEGAVALNINDSNEIEIETTAGIIKMTKPVAYQIVKGERIEVAVSYNIAANGDKSVLEYGFITGNYNKEYPLIIDPLIASTFAGGWNEEIANSLTADPVTGDILITGFTYSFDYPVTPAAFDTVYNAGSYDIFISRLSSDLSTLIASTYIGGVRGDFAYSITANFIKWNGKNSAGTIVPAGVYTYRIFVKDNALNGSVAKTGKVTVN